MLSNLLEDGVHIRDMRTIIETLADAATRTTDPVELTAVVRTALRASIAQIAVRHHARAAGHCAGPRARKGPDAIAGHRQRDAAAFEPGLVDLLQRGAAVAAKRQEDIGLNPTLLVPDRLRLPLTRLLRRAAPRLRVLGHTEVPETSTIRVSTVLGAPA